MRGAACRELPPQRSESKLTQRIKLMALIRFHSKDLSTFSPSGLWTFGGDPIGSEFVANH